MAGKFLAANGEKLLVRGVSYGPFRDETGAGFPTPGRVERDFALMASSGVNTVRTYCVPPLWVLDAALGFGLRIIVGVPWEQHVAFLTKRSEARSLESRVAAGVAACAGHPAVLAYAVGNEIPASIVRWHGARAVSHFLEQLCARAKIEDPEGLVTYANYPSTEYLELPFLDFVSFNVYLEGADLLEAYLRRLQNIAGDRPLVLSEVGLDSRRHGEVAQARFITSHLDAVYAAGCAGAIVFAWTDEWHRAGRDVLDWDFGLTDRNQRPKPALRATRDAFESAPFPLEVERPRVSVVVCSHNGARTISRCLEGVAALNYPDYECIVVDDGSTDDTAAIASRFDVQVIRTTNQGLGSARNTGLAAARGEIVAYLDDDAWPDTDWLEYLAHAFRSTEHACIGGPNIAPLAAAGTVAECVKRAPGGPIHVLLTDEEAEHLPGCNMAFRRDRLEELAGFDPQFWVAGDDVDICWRIRERGWTLGYHPGAAVWHERRTSIRAYARQQLGYGRAEALLARKWPEKYNRGGHVRWAGRVYSGNLSRERGIKTRVYYGLGGSALFQRVYVAGAGTLRTLPLTPDWYLLIAALGLAGLYGVFDNSVALDVPLLGVPAMAVACIAAVGVLVASAARAGWRAVGRPGRPLRDRMRIRALTGLLYLAQPLARLVGRLAGGLSPWRVVSGHGFAVPLPRRRTEWAESWRSLAERLSQTEARLRRLGVGVIRASGYERWDLEAHAGSMGSVRIRAAVEEYGEGRQNVLYRVTPHVPRAVLLLTLGAIALTVRGLVGNPSDGTYVLLALTGGLVAKIAADCAAAMAATLAAVSGSLELASAADDGERPPPRASEMLTRRMALSASERRR